jgi:murein DD-endopeptidase MepM/ murein hydrolase activator NlpD
MVNPKYIQPYGDQLMLMMDDGTQYLAYRSQTLWVVNHNPSGSGNGGLEIVTNPPSSITAKDVDGVVYTFDETEITRMIQVLQTAIPINGVTEEALIVVFITAITESHFRNLSNTTAYPESGGFPNIDGDGSDGTSLGLFQQTPPNGWGTPEELCTVSYATHAFIGGPTGPNGGSPAGLFDISPPWNDGSRTPGEAAQAVQGSAYPDRYDKVVPVAQACLNALLTPTSGSGQFSWPFNVNTVTSEYGPRTGPIGSFHEGIDFGYNPAVSGAKEYAAGAGTVEAINLNSNYGYSVQIKHGVDGGGYGLHTIYAHMRSNPLVSPGQKVNKGQLLGYLGASGDATGPHLHWETHTCPSDGPIVHNTTSTSSGLAIRTAINPRDFMTTYGDGQVISQ